MRRRWLVLVVIAVLGLAAGAVALMVPWGERAPILVGLLHSKTGPWAVAEQSMLEAELLAIEEINAAGGLLGRRVRAVEADGRSDAPTFARQAQRLIHDDKVSVLIGCWASEARRAVRPVVEEAQHLLIYPPQYEGLEESPNIVYTGGPANQQIIPTVGWCCDVRKARKFFLIGSESIHARAAGAVVKDVLKTRQAELVGEAYLGVDTGGVRDDVNDAVGRIERAAPDVVISTVEGADSPAFYGQLRRAGITPDRVPVLSFSLDEEGVRGLPIANVVGQYAAWDYFQSLDGAGNREFVRKFKAKYGSDRVVDDNLQIAYQSVRVWAETVDDVETADVQAVNHAIIRQSLNAPEGIITIDSENRHGWRPYYLGRVRPDGQFDIVWSLTRSIRPIPFPASRTQAEWEALLEDIASGPRGRGSAPTTETADRKRPPP
jgi:urea transport system substrate-binding protein